MKLAPLALAALAFGCKERGTITIDLSGHQTCSSATTVLAFLFPNTTCETCGGCNSDCDCVGDCIPECGPGCPADEPIVFDPPAAGRFAAVYRFLDANGNVNAVVCAQVDVDADGTESKVVEPTRAECCP